MERLVNFLFLLFVLACGSLCISRVHGEESLVLEPSETVTSVQQDTEAVTEFSIKSNDAKEKAEHHQHEQHEQQQQRSIGDDSDVNEDADGQTPSNEDSHEAFRRRARPLKNIFMGIYKNYKSTFLGNKTLTEYKRKLRTRGQDQVETNDGNEQTIYSYGEENETTKLKPTEETTTTSSDINETSSLKIQNSVDDNRKPQMKYRDRAHPKQSSSKRKKKKQRKRNKLQHKAKHEASQSSIYRYDFGHGFNMSLDMSNDIVNVRLDGESLKDIMQGRWMKGASEGRGKKYEMITRVLPLFIIPFLIQSAVVPFLVTKLKLLVMKSILVGKIAIFVLVISAIKNSNKMMQTYEVAPSYWAGEPSRRSELAAAASAASYNGYRVDGKPAAWIN